MLAHLLAYSTWWFDAFRFINGSGCIHVKEEKSPCARPLKWMVKTQWDRELARFIGVSENI
jgi:hypothetical protein